MNIGIQTKEAKGLQKCLYHRETIYFEPVALEKVVKHPDPQVKEKP